MQDPATCFSNRNELWQEEQMCSFWCEATMACRSSFASCNTSYTSCKRLQPLCKCFAWCEISINSEAQIKRLWWWGMQTGTKLLQKSLWLTSFFFSVLGKGSRAFRRLAMCSIVWIHHQPPWKWISFPIPLALHQTVWHGADANHYCQPLHLL